MLGAIRGVLAGGTIAGLMAMATVHEEMNERAGEEEQVRQCSANVRFVFIPEEVERDRCQ